MSILRSLLSGCWFSHSYVTEMRGKGGKQRAVQVCEDCGHVTRFPQVKKGYRDRVAKAIPFERPFQKRKAG